MAGKASSLFRSKKSRSSLMFHPIPAHNDPAVHDGFGDTAFLVKYRFLSGNEKHGNYILTAFLGWSLPTGDNKNGSFHPVITPTIAYGKGFGNFDMQGTFGVGLPTADANLSGRNYLWNNTFQYRVLRKLWPELEFDSTFFQNGPNEGQKQNFVTPDWFDDLVCGEEWDYDWRRIPDSDDPVPYK